jgi:hypothetical protein
MTYGQRNLLPPPVELGLEEELLELREWAVANSPLLGRTDSVTVISIERGWRKC